MKKSILGALALGLFFCANLQVCDASTGIYVNYHSQDEIKQYLAEHSVNMDNVIKYSTAPALKANGSKGSLSSETLDSALQTLNAVRYIAGIYDEVELNSTYTNQAQAAAYVMALNKSISHAPDKPSGVSDSLYNQAVAGASSSNLAWASWNHGLESTIINSWMDDSDDFNIGRLGHRRWILNPTMKQTGFGSVYDKSVGTFSVMYAFDGFLESTNYSGVAWPAQNMPIEYFENDHAWSISMGKEVNASKVKVILKRKSDNKTWLFSQSASKGYFAVSNEGYGAKGCIIFRPDGAEYKSGDVYNVKITGLDKEVEYDVNFFTISDICMHAYGSTKVVKKATLKNDGKKVVVCDKCGEEIPGTIYRIKKVKLKKKTLKYNGKTKKPVIIVKDSKGNSISNKYYKVKYNKKPKKKGKYKVTIRFKGMYKGKKVLYFKIK
ncbi:MAG: CAP domain-containing protein [Lachnospiraceae bacterium]|nr:CAP domain-containing protein [Lachnospiraceae bacterium]